MSKTTLFTLFFVSFSIIAFAGHGNHRPTEKRISLSGSFVPIGFDSNDRIQFVVSGEFPNTCYQISGHTSQVRGSTIEVEQNANVYGGICLQVRVPFYQVIELDKMLDKGKYTIVDAGSNGILGVLSVEKATNPGPGPDDFLYAPVSDAFVVTDGVSGDRKMILQGEFTNNCMIFEDIKIKPYGNQIIVLPIVDKKDEPNCAETSTRFEKHVLLPNVKTPYLLHVRSMNGQGINKIVSGNTN